MVPTPSELAIMFDALDRRDTRCDEAQSGSRGMLFVNSWSTFSLRLDIDLRKSRTASWSLPLLEGISANPMSPSILSSLDGNSSEELPPEIQDSALRLHLSTCFLPKPLRLVFSRNMAPAFHTFALTGWLLLPAGRGLQHSPRSTPSAATESADSGRKNVLFILADDMRPDLGAYGNTDVHTPNIDTLAHEGTTFDRAYTNFPACAPSRNSFMSGRLPDTTKGYTFKNHFREPGIGENWRSLPQYFKEVGGYYTAMSGKVFHAKLPPNNDYPNSWTVKPYTPDCRPKDGCPDSVAEELPLYPEKSVNCSEGKLRRFMFCAAEVAANETRLEKKLVDQRTRDSCIRQIREGSNLSRSGKVSGFFVACGFHKPHASFVFPADFLEHYPKHAVDKLHLVGYPWVPAKSPVVAWAETTKSWGANQGYNATQSEDWVRALHRANYAAISYIDHCIGGVLHELEKLDHKNDTLVVLTTDHSVALGEQGTFGKMTNWDSSLHIPLIMRAPWLQQSQGQRSSMLAELVDLYATLTDLAGLPPPESVGEYINGTSLAPVLRDPSANRKIKKGSLARVAFSQLAKPYLDFPNSRKLTCQRDELEVMGYSVRANNRRYTAWFRFNGTGTHMKTGELIGRELYFYKDERGEIENVVDNPKYAKFVERLHDMVLSKMRVQLNSSWERPSRHRRQQRPAADDDDTDQ